MEKLDRLGWAAGVAFEAFGLKVGIRVNKTEALAGIADYLPPGAKIVANPEVDVLFSLRLGGTREGSRIREYHLLYQGPSRVVRTLDRDQLYEALESELALAVGEFAPDRVFVHAGVVGWNGKAIVVPGKTHSGKSTLIAELVRAGAVYYSDEYAVLDDQGRVHPYPRRLSLRQPEGKPTLRRAPQELGGTAGTQAMPVGLVAVATYVPGARWQPRPLRPGQAVCELFQRTLPARLFPDRSLNFLHRLVDGAQALKSARGEAEEMVSRLLHQAA